MVKKNNKKTNKGGKDLDKSKWPIVAICYDFDKTLSPEDMQNYAILPDLNVDPVEFWKNSNDLAKKYEMDTILSYMNEIIKKAKSIENFSMRRNAFQKYGKSVKLFPGVSTWFNRINDYADSLKINVEHYIISAGLKEVIEGTSIFKHFKEVFACSFCYGKDKVAEWPAQIVNATSKTQYLFRISKNCLSLTDEQSVHKMMDAEDVRIPFKNIIYIGDSLTDVPAMRVVNKEGGISIGVYDESACDKQIDMHLLKIDKRINYYMPANYQKNSALEKLIKDILRSKDLQFLAERQLTESNEKIINHIVNLLKEEGNEKEVSRCLRKNFTPYVMKKILEEFTVKINNDNLLKKEQDTLTEPTEEQNETRHKTEN